MNNFNARYGGTIVYETTRDSGGMFDACLGVEQLPGGERYRAFVIDWHGGVQCFRGNLEDAKAELNRLFEKKFGHGS